MIYVIYTISKQGITTTHELLRRVVFGYSKQTLNATTEKLIFGVIALHLSVSHG